MIDYETYCKIRNLCDVDGLSIRKISLELGLSFRTVAKWAAAKSYHPRRNGARDSKLDPYKAEIVRMLERHAYSGQQVFQRLRDAGYSGGRTILNEYIAKVRPRPKTAHLTLNFAPGECAQVDWGEFGSVPVGRTRRRLSFFAMVLCFSRMLFVRFTLGQGMEHFLQCHQEAFNYFEGVPQRIMVDNLKCAVLKRLIGNAPVFNPRYLDFARHHGFTISPCNVGKGNEKGRVENAVAYVKYNFLRGLDIPNFEVLTPLADDWMRNVANVRIHGTTRKRPVDLFDEDKRNMRPLPGILARTGRIENIRANSAFRVVFETNRYSVPYRYASKRLRMYVYADELYFYDGQNLIARHARSYDRHQDFEHPNHVAGLLSRRGKARYQKLLTDFLNLAPCATSYHEGLKSRTVSERHHVRQIMALVESYGPDAVVRALTDCHEFQVYNAAYIANLLEQRARKLPQPGALHLSRREDLLELELPKPDLDAYGDGVSLDPSQQHPQQGEDDEPQSPTPQPVG